MPRIFLSYRRVDNPFFAGRLRDRLSSEYGDEDVFFDVGSVPLGADFREVVRDTLSVVDVVVALIGPSWNAPKLSERNDFVRMELEEALTQAKIVIPVLIADTPMPGPHEFPEALERLAFLNALRVRPDPDFRRDTDRLVNGIRQAISRRDALVAARSEQSRPAPQELASGPAESQSDAVPTNRTTVGEGSAALTRPIAAVISGPREDTSETDTAVAREGIGQEAEGVSGAMARLLPPVPAGESTFDEDQASQRDRSETWADHSCIETPASALAFPEHGALLACAGRHGIEVWDLERSEQMWDRTSQEAPRNFDSVDWSVDGTYIAGLSSERLFLWSAAEGRVINERGDCGSAGVRFSVNDSVVVCGAGVYEVPSLADRLSSTATRFSVTRAGIVARRTDRVVVLEHLETQQTIATVDLRERDRVFNLAISATGALLAIAGLSTTVWDVHRNTLLFEIPGTSFALAFSADSSRLAIGAVGSILVVDCPTGDIAFQDDGISPNDVSLSADGRWLACCDGRIVRTWEAPRSARPAVGPALRN